MSTPHELRLVGRIGATVSQLASLDLDTVSDPSLLELARQVRQLACRLQSVEIQLVGAIDGRGATLAEGLKSTSSWLRSQLRVADSTARLRCAHAVTTMPAVEQAFAAGEISLEHLRAIARVVADLDEEGHLGTVEHVLVDEARITPPARFARTAARIRDQIAPDRVRGRGDQPRVAPRWLNIRRTSDGTVAVSGRFDHEAGDDVIETVEALAVPAGENDVRPAARRRADALLALCREAVMRRPTTSSHGRSKTRGPSARAVTGLREPVDVERHKPVRPGSRRRPKRSVKRRARR